MSEQSTARFQAALARHLLAFFLLVAPALAFAGNDDLITNGSFLRAHPDMYWRALGQDALAEGREREAFDHLRKSARYADKVSQAMVAEMIWNGRGVARDRALAYAWMDLASERGYKPLVIVREQYWAALSATEQARAVDVGEKVFAEFGDKVAQPRMNRELLRGSKQVTGSRVGHVGSVRIPGSLQSKGSLAVMDAADLGNVTNGAVFYQDKFWKPELYWQWQDSLWQEGRKRNVEVQPIVQPDDAAQP